MSVVTPLYGHVSPETAYLVADYPYGRKVRCRIRYWIERHPSKGHRFVSQTEHPVGKYWNSPKRSTYSPFGMAMYLDEVGYVQWAVVGRTPESTLYFVRSFPGADLSEPRILAKLALARAEAGARGEIRWTINDVTQPVSEADLARYAAEAEGWRRVVAHFIGGATTERPPPLEEGAPS